MAERRVLERVKTVPFRRRWCCSHLVLVAMIMVFVADRHLGVTNRISRWDRAYTQGIVLEDRHVAVHVETTISSSSDDLFQIDRQKQHLQLQLQLHHQEQGIQQQPLSWHERFLVKLHGEAGISDQRKQRLEKKFRTFFDRLGKDKNTPLLVGGVGDSGTRAIVDLFENLDLDFSVHSRYRDSKAFMDTYRIPVNDTAWNVSAPFVYERILPIAANFSFTRDNLEDAELWWVGLEFALTVLKKQIKGCKKSRDIWGMKQPRLTLFLPIFKYIFEEDLKYIHVVRDFRDTSTGTRKFFYRQLCPYFYHGELKDKKCAGGLKNRLEFNAKWNLDAVSWLQNNLLGHQYYVVRVEDLVSGNLQCFLDIVHFVQRKFNQTIDGHNHETLLKTVADFHVYQNRYEGNKLPPAERKTVNEAAKARPIVTYALQYFHYPLPDENDLEAPWKSGGTCPYPH